LRWSLVVPSLTAAGRSGFLLRGRGRRHRPGRRVWDTCGRGRWGSRSNVGKSAWCSFRVGTQCSGVPRVSGRVRVPDRAVSDRSRAL